MHYYILWTSDMQCKCRIITEGTTPQLFIGKKVGSQLSVSKKLAQSRKIA